CALPAAARATRRPARRARKRSGHFSRNARDPRFVTSSWGLFHRRSSDDGEDTVGHQESGARKPVCEKRRQLPIEPRNLTHGKAGADARAGADPPPPGFRSVRHADVVGKRLDATKSGFAEIANAARIDAVQIANPPA